MRAFITGATGFVGTHLSRKLLERGWSVRVLVHKTPISKADPYEVVRGDITDGGLLKEALKGVDVLFHLAAALGGSLIGKKEFFRINGEGTQKVIEASFQAGVQKALHFSSAGVLGAVRTHGPAEENHPPDPKNAYDFSKLEGERFALDAAARGAPVLVIRPGWVYGPGDRRTFKLIRAIANRKFMLVTRGKALQTPVYIDDLVEGALLCSERGKNGEVYHLAGNEVLSVKQIADLIAQATESSIPKITLPVLPTRAAAWMSEKTFRLFKKEGPLTRGKLAFFIHPKPLSIQKAKDHLGYVPGTGFEAGMRKAVLWYRKQGWL